QRPFLSRNHLPINCAIWDGRLIEDWLPSGSEGGWLSNPGVQNGTRRHIGLIRVLQMRVVGIGWVLSQCIFTLHARNISPIVFEASDNALDSRALARVGHVASRLIDLLIRQGYFCRDRLLIAVMDSQIAQVLCSSSNLAGEHIGQASSCQKVCRF